MSETTRPPIARTHYFTGESLLTDDFVCEQQFNMEMRALINSTLRTWGVAQGLEVSWQQGSTSDQLSISPGMAIDRLGRQIVLNASQVLKVDSAASSPYLYLTIRYNEVLADYTVESGVPGYKRVVQQPVLECLPTLQEPGIHILLAIVCMSSQGTVDALAYKSGKYERRYVGSRLGLLQLVTEGSGVKDAGVATPSPLYGVQFKALQDSQGEGDYLEVQARRSQFSGMLTTRDNLGIGVDHPQANLQVERIVHKGPGTLSTQGKLLTLIGGTVYPPLRPGDLVIPELPANAAPLQPSQGVIESATDNVNQYRLQQAFQEDILQPCAYTYVRSTLARFSAGQAGELLRIDIDGSVGLGLQAGVQSGTAGPSALTITTDRRVGIALNTGMSPQAALQVNGGVIADALTCNGTVTAQSFEGNGAKLKNLPILSYWTKQNVSSPYSAIYYDSGNVGVQMMNPPASLSVGTGPAFIGSGLLSAVTTDNTQLQGTQTAFLNEVIPGDSIVLGSLIEQYRQIKAIVSNEELELTEQFPTIVRQSTFKYVPADSPLVPGNAQLPLSDPSKAVAVADPASAQDGTGTISSSGVQVIGKGTQFTKELVAGDWLVVPAFTPTVAPANQKQWLVDKVINDTTLQVVNQDGVAIPANVSAYMVTPSLLGMFQCNADPTKVPPPAMLVVNNGQGADPVNTVAINVTLDQLNQDYALQVNGAAQIHGSSVFDDLTTTTLTVKQWASMTGSGNNGVVLAAGPSAEKTLLSVTQNNVVIGTSTGQSLLEVGGDAHATGNIIAAQQLQGASASVTGAVTAGSLEAKAMDVSGLAVDASGNVTAFGSRVPINISTSAPIQTQLATTDGFIVATLYPINKPFASDLICTTQTQSGGPTSTVRTSASTVSFINSSSKDGTNYTTVQQSATMCVPVRKGEIWQLQFSFDKNGKLAAAGILAYWVPLGPGATQAQAMLAASPVMPAAMQEDAVQGGAATPSGAAAAPVGAPQPFLLSSGRVFSQADAQRESDQRMVDLARVLGDATQMPADPAVRAPLIQQLQKIACLATPPGGSLDPQRITDVIDTFARLTGHPLGPVEQALLDQGIRALIGINDNDESRNNVELIGNNIRQLMQSLQQVTSIAFNPGQTRLLTRALMRLVGDGTQEPAQVAPDAPRS
jgi:hypothetical protein